MRRWDAVVVGSGPNGLSAALTLARAGKSVRVVEAADSWGGGIRSAALTRPGYVHDVCSAVHPLAALSPAFRSFELHAFGLAWIEPPLALAHPLDDGRAAVLARDVSVTAASLGADAQAWRSLFVPLVGQAAQLLDDALAPLHWPAHPLLLARFGRLALRSAASLASRFREPRARALIAGLAGHSFLALDEPASAAVALVLTLAAHVVGWPFPQRGAGALGDALVSALRAHGGEVVTGTRVDSVDDLPPSRTLLLDVGPREAARIAGQHLPKGNVRRLRGVPLGPGVFKVDWALDGPVPWRAEACRRAGTVHVGGTFEEIAAAEQAVARGEVPERPFVLVAQPSLFDGTRAPPGGHTLWGYCHVPNGSEADMTEAIEAQIERFAPGFLRRIVARATKSAVEMERYNASYTGGDISGGRPDWRHLVSRPWLKAFPYATGTRGTYLCSSATPPGPGVHGLCGFYAARAALRFLGA